MKGLALMSIGAWGGLLLLTPRGKQLKLLQNPFVLGFSAYYCWAALSVLWSIDPGLSMRRLAVLFFCGFGCLGFARHLRIRDMITMALYVGTLYAVIGLLTEFAIGSFMSQEHPGGYRFGGTVHPNAQGAYLGMLCTAAFSLSRIKPERKLFYLSWMAFGVILLMMTKSRTSFAAMLLSVGVIASIDYSLKFKLVGTIAISWLGSLVLIGAFLQGLDPAGEIQEMSMMGRGEESSALTGRIPIWMELSNYIAQRPLTGYGYGAFWNPANIEVVSANIQWVFREAHSSYVEALLGLGLIGLLILLGIAFLGILLSLQQYRRTKDTSYAFVVAIIFQFLVSGFMESVISSPTFLLLVAITCLIRLGSGVESSATNHPETPPKLA